jgi:hypothetical protein
MAVEAPTLAALQLLDAKVSVSCSRCKAYRSVDLGALVGRAGAEARIDALKFRCQACGAPGSAWIYAPMLPAGHYRVWPPET